MIFDRSVDDWQARTDRRAHDALVAAVRAVAVADVPATLLAVSVRRPPGAADL